MPTRVCIAPTCPDPPVYRGRCQRHARQRERTINRAGRKLYRTAKWKHTRNRILADHPLCECGQIATDVHHIQDLADGGAPYDPANLRAMCAKCHGKITRRTQHT